MSNNIEVELERVKNLALQNKNMIDDFLEGEIESLKKFGEIERKFIDINHLMKNISEREIVDIKQSLKSISEGISGIKDQVNDFLFLVKMTQRDTSELQKKVDKLQEKVENNEKAVNNLLIKIIGFASGSGGLIVIIAEIIKTSMGG